MNLDLSSDFYTPDLQGIESVDLDGARKFQIEFDAKKKNRQA